jgi:hypothetical protein
LSSITRIFFIKKDLSLTENWDVGIKIVIVINILSRLKGWIEQSHERMGGDGPILGLKKE